MSTVSSHLSGLGFTPDRDTDISSEAFEETEAVEFLKETEVAAEPAGEVFEEIQLTSEDTCGEPKTADMSGPGPTDHDAATEVIILCALRKKVEYKIRRMDASRVTDNSLSVMKEKLHDIQELAEEYGLGMISFLEKYPSIEESFRLQYESDLSNFHQLVDDHEDRICEKIHSLETANQPSVGQPAARCGTQPQPGAQQSGDISASLASATTIAKAEVKYNTLLDMALTATQDMEEDSLYLETASNEKISKLVQKISEYKKGKDKIKSTYNEYLEFTAVHKPASVSHDPKKLHSAVQKVISVADALISELENEDDERGLYTLLPRKTEKAKWPTFSGRPGESFFKFKEKFVKTARQNMTSKSDQFTKLRENLKDFPLTLVPESLDDISKAFDRLADTYGDPQKLADFELKKLNTVSMIPNCDDGSYTLCTRAQAEWLLSLETVLAELVKMGNADDADIDLTRSVFGPQTTSIILGKFPPVLKQRLVRAAKSDPSTEKLVTYQTKVKEWSKQALEMEKYEPEVKTVPKKPALQIQYIRDTKVNLFKPPKALPSCIICVELQKKQEVSPQLPHLSNHITGCPMFIEMNIITRNNISEILKLCKSCLRLDSNDHEKYCMVLTLKNKKQNNGKTKYDFTCRDKFCHRHM